MAALASPWPKPRLKWSSGLGPSSTSLHHRSARSCRSHPPPPVTTHQCYGSSPRLRFCQRGGAGDDVCAPAVFPILLDLVSYSCSAGSGWPAAGSREILVCLFFIEQGNTCWTDESCRSPITFVGCQWPIESNNSNRVPFTVLFRLQHANSLHGFVANWKHYAIADAFPSSRTLQLRFQSINQST